MDERERGPKDMSVGERIGTLAAASASAGMLSAEGDHETERGAEQRVDRQTAERIVEGWPKAPQNGARQMLEQYGPPNEATPTKLMWYGNGPWKRTVVTSDEVIHNFPAPHTDYLTQHIDYQVPVDSFVDLGRYDGSCLVDRTSGEVAARCDSEAANFLTLNLMHDIVTGRTSVEDARTVYAENMAAFTMGRPTPYCEGFQFDVPQGGTEDPDEAVMGAATMARQAAGKVKDALTGGTDESPRTP